jgi:lactate dehydrogenase-like 2-hydroxyacid dehydrogenase
VKPKVLITRKISKVVIDSISEHCDVRVHDFDEMTPPSLRASSLRDLDAIMPCGLRVSKTDIARAPKLRVVANIGAGCDNIDVDACSRRGIPVTNTPGVVTEATADIAFALMLSSARRVIEADRFVRRQLWSHWQWNFLWGSEMHGKVLGLYGFGQIAQAVARRAQGFSMKILYHTRRRVPANIENVLGARWVDRETLLRESDFLSLHIPLTPETRHLISWNELALMKQTAFIINTSRGSIIEEDALAAAMQAGKLGGAGLDVFEHEPTVHPALTVMENVVLLPHIGTATAETRLHMALLASKNLLAALAGRRPPNLVNPEAFGEKFKFTS